MKILNHFFQTGSFQNSKEPIKLPNYGLLDLPSDEEEQKQQSIVLNNIASDEGDDLFSVEAIEAENQLTEESKNTCQRDQSDYCQAKSASENSFKTSNHTMCKYCVSWILVFSLINIFN